jgi:uncharacterized protein YbbC (DUF1343 family)
MLKNTQPLLFTTNNVMPLLFFLLFPLFASCAALVNAGDNDSGLRTGAARTELYFPLLEGKRIAVAGNHTSLIQDVHLVDSLIRAGFHVVKVFSPEHGFRGKAADGEYVSSGTDTATGLSIVSLYGSNRKPTPEQLKDIDLIVFDIQDAGARFYTYISTMTYIMEAAALADIPVLILDRPNPLGYIVDGPVLESGHASFVGLHPVPVLHGMTVGEYAQMVNGESWLADGLHCDVQVIPVEGYSRKDRYHLPVPPSPNLPDMRSVYLYPSLCFFEGTVVSLGRGTTKPFQVYGHPAYNPELFPYQFTPVSMPSSLHPPQQGNACFGIDLSMIPLEVLENTEHINLAYLLEAYSHFPDKENFFIPYFERLAGTKKLRQQIQSGWGEDQIRASWQADLETFREMREQYLLYPNE